MSRKSVLIVDDEKNMRTTLADILREEGFEVTVIEPLGIVWTPPRGSRSVVRRSETPITSPSIAPSFTRSPMS